MLVHGWLNRNPVACHCQKGHKQHFVDSELQKLWNTNNIVHFLGENVAATWCIISKEKLCNDLQGHAANYESETVAEISRSARDYCSKFLHSSPLIMNFSLGNQWMQNTDKSISKLSLQTSTWLWCSLYFVFSFLSTYFKTFSIILVLIILRVRRDSQYCKVTHQFSSTARFNA